MKRFFGKVVVLSLFLLFTIGPSIAAEYLITDLGIGKARAINNLSQVVGESEGYAVLWEANSMTVLSEGSANSINDLGQVVGGSWINNGLPWDYLDLPWAWDNSGLPLDDQTTFLWQDGIVEQLGLFLANAINNNGEIAGASWFDFDIDSYYPNYTYKWYKEIHAAVWQDGQIYDLGFVERGDLPKPRNSQAFDINSWGEVLVVGEHGIDYGPEEYFGSFLYFEDEKMIDLVTGFTEWSGRRAYSVNNAGVIVGTGNKGESGKSYDAYIWTYEDGPDFLEALNDPPCHFNSGAHSINELGLIVGWAFNNYKVERDLGHYAVLWDENLQLHVLDDFIPNGLGWHLEVANDINDIGQIVGYGIKNNEPHAFLLSPNPLPNRGTIGTEITIKGSGFGDAKLGKNKVYIGNERCVLLEWNDSEIRGFLRNTKGSIGPGIYDITIEPNVSGPIVMEEAFIIEGPRITSVFPQVCKKNDIVTIEGWFFGVKVGKVKGEVNVTDKNGYAKKLNIKHWSMDPITGYSIAQIKMKQNQKIDSGWYDIVLNNKINSDYVENAVYVE
jgi:probable HAF family extracellular repeat protein